MPIHERILQHAESGESPDAQWFAVRQPGIVRFLCERLQGDALSLGLFAARRICLAFQADRGRPGERVSSSSLACAEELVCRRKHGEAHGAAGLSEHHPALVAWIAELLDDPPVPLSRDERRELGLALLAVAQAFDHTP